MISSASPPGGRGIFLSFVQSEAASSVLLMACTALALAWANSPWHTTYDALLHSTLGVTVGNRVFSLSGHAWINDGLMALFFFVVGLEIKREVVAGQLSSVRLAVLPAAAALGGMLVPAAVYAVFNAGGPGANGWGIPMATDIAFALGVLALLGPRVPSSLRVFLAAVAIADDLGAVIVIAAFYTQDLAWLPLQIGAAIFLALVLVNLVGVRHAAPYLLLG